jgi:hypothetical protein
MIIKNIIIESTKLWVFFVIIIMGIGLFLPKVISSNFLPASIILIIVTGLFLSIFLSSIIYIFNRVKKFMAEDTE